MRVIRLSFTALAFAGLAPAQARPATPPSLRTLSGAFQALVEKVDPAVVQIVTRGFAPSEEGGVRVVQARRGSGSGVLIDPDGFIVTNAHVIGSARRVQVLLPQKADDRARHSSILKPTGKLVPAEVVGLDRETDVAVLKIEGKGLPHLPLGDSESVRQGQLVFAFGSPFGLENSVTMGVVSSVARQVRAEDPMIYIQTDASINPGNSGGPLVDADGAVVGINTFILSQSGGNEGIGFAAPSSVVKTVYEQIRKYGRVRRGQIGIQAHTITPELAQALELKQDWGVMISDVRPRSPAEAAGLEIKDIVLTCGGRAMENARQFGVNIYQHAGEIVEVEILRGGDRIKKQIAVGERPQDPDRILSLVEGDANLVPKLGILAVDLNAKVAPLLPELRKLSGAVVAGVVADISSTEDAFHTGDVIYAVNTTAVRSLEELKAAVRDLKAGQPVAVQVERLGQLQYLLFEIE